jgi:hypothetical protein
LLEFKAISTSNGVSITWKSKSEANYKSYEVERSIDAVSYKSIITKDASGSNNTYTFIDEEVFKQTGGKNEIQQSKYYYRLKVNFKDGSSDKSDEIYVIHQTSSIRKTWGMLKEMFK